MKNTSRIRRKTNHKNQSPQGKNPSIHGPDKFKTPGAGKLSLQVLIASSKPEIEQIAVRWDAKKRRKVANNIETWITELRLSADLMDGKSVLENVN
jgi:hypothetical protein